jgi:hypothetical protein
MPSKHVRFFYAHLVEEDGGFLVEVSPNEEWPDSGWYWQVLDTNPQGPFDSQQEAEADHERYFP